MEGNLADNDHELEGNEGTMKMHFKKDASANSDNCREGCIDRKSIAKLEAGSFQNVIIRAKK